MKLLCSDLSNELNCGQPRQSYYEVQSEQSLQDSKNCTQKYIGNENVFPGLYNESATHRLAIASRRSLELLWKMQLRKHIALRAEKAPDPACLRVSARKVVSLRKGNA